MTARQLLDLSGSTIAVTGASSGIGRATARLLSELGARVVLVGRDGVRLTETLGQLSGNGHLCESFDLNQLDQIPRWLGEVVERAGPLAGLVHAAGVHGVRPLQTTTPAFLDNLMRVNLSAAIALAKALRQKHMHVKPASLVFVASVAGLRGDAGLSAYAASKGALQAAVRPMALELAPERIRVNCVSPALVQTEMTDRFEAMLTEPQRAAVRAKHPMGLGEPHDVACAIAFLLSPMARWVTGSNLVVDGGYTAA